MLYPIKTLSQLRPILQGFRKEAGLTQAALAERLGVSQQNYAKLEANPASVSMERLHAVFSVLNVEMALSQAGVVAVTTSPTAPTRKPAPKATTKEPQFLRRVTSPANKKEVW